MEKLWTGRFSKTLDAEADDFNSSLSFDKRMYKQDIKGSMAHAEMLASCSIITPSEADSIISGLKAVLDDIESGKLSVCGAEDIHSFVEAELTRRIGENGKKLHTARSRNDQVALDLRMYLRDEINETVLLLKSFIATLCSLAEKHLATVMPGYTHMQRAQPVTLAHQLMAYASMLLRDISRFEDCKKRMNISPLGSCALAGTTYPTNRDLTASLLGFDSPCINSADGVSDRDFAIEAAFACSLTATHLSRFAEEVILWCSWEFGFAEPDDAYSTGSSIMPQKKNPDVAELVRGKCGRVNGNLVTLLTVMKGLPLAYNKDMQEDKEAVFDSMDTVKHCLSVFAPTVATLKFRPEKMKQAASNGFINATDCADYLVGKGIPFRTAYKITGGIIAYCAENSKTLETLSLSEYRTFCPEFDDGIYKAVDLDECVKKRFSFGGTAPEAVKKSIDIIRSEISDD